MAPFHCWDKGGHSGLDEPEDWPDASLEAVFEEDGEWTEPVNGAGLTAEERLELVELFPTPRDKDGHLLKPVMREVAMVRKDNPREGASHTIIGNSLTFPMNRVYQRRVLYSFYRKRFRECLEAGGSIYRATPTVGTDTADDEGMRKAERREWERLEEVGAAERFPHPRSLVHRGVAGRPRDPGDLRRHFPLR